MLFLAALLPHGLALNAGVLAARRAPVHVRMADDAFGASHTSFYTDTKKKDHYASLEEILETKCSDKELQSLMKTLFDACGTITEALRVELVTVADEQNSAFGDVQVTPARPR